MLDTRWNAEQKRYEVEVEGFLFQWVLSGYCGRLLQNIDPDGHGRLFANTPTEPETIVELTDGTLVRAGTRDEQRWMIGTYLRGVRLGVRPADPYLASLAEQSDIRRMVAEGSR